MAVVLLALPLAVCPRGGLMGGCLQAAQGKLLQDAVIAKGPSVCGLVGGRIIRLGLLRLW